MTVNHSAFVDIDPVTFEVVKHRLWQINDEQATAIRTISASPIVVEGNDFNAGLYTAEGRVVIAGSGSLVHVTTTGTAIEHILKLADDLGPGDIYLTNDPYLGALHQNDVVIAGPVYRQGKLFMWCGNVVHHPDVGGIDEGSFCINAHSLYQEPPRYFLRVVERGRLCRDVERTFVANSRLPDAVALDLRAQIGAIHAARDRIDALLDTYGEDVVAATMEYALAYAAEDVRARLRELPDGLWEADAYMDGDRVGREDIVRVHVSLEKRGERLIFDYTGSDPQRDAPVNCTFHALYAGTAVPLYTFLCGADIDWNDGLRAVLEVRAPEGTVVNARFPAPVSICTIGFRWLVTVAASQVVAHMFAASERHQDRVCSSWNVSSNCVNVFGQMDGQHVGALLSDHRAGGAAARSFADGYSHAGQTTSFASNVANVESIEEKLPLLYLFRHQLPDSGGPGRFRGGLTAVCAVTPFETDELIFKATNTAGTNQTNALGIAGGYPGAGSQVSLYRGAVRKEPERLLLPTTLQDLTASAKLVEHLPSKADGVIRPGDVLAFYAPGGGGYGDPIDRDVAAVVVDVSEGQVTPQWAATIYGVVLDRRGKPELAATAVRREAIRRERLGERGTHVYPKPLNSASITTGWRRIGDALIWYSDGGSPAGRPSFGPAGGIYRCARCGFDFGPHVSPAFPGRELRRRSEIGAAGPWRAVRWGGKTPDFALEEMLCPACGALVHVAEVRR